MRVVVQVIVEFLYCKVRHTQAEIQISRLETLASSHSSPFLYQSNLAPGAFVDHVNTAKFHRITGTWPRLSP